MIIFPAIDILSGQCVRLKKGEYSSASKVAESPFETAARFKAAGAKWIHTVDLDGAKSARPENATLLIEIAKTSGLSVEVGGGIRCIETVGYYLENGISRVILGSAAIDNTELVKESINTFGGERIAVGIDAKGENAAADGWTRNSAVTYTELAKRMEDIGVKYIIYTDISKDGMLSGPSFERLFELNRCVGCNIVASGGVSSTDDIIKLRDAGLYGAICGKAIYPGDIDLNKAVKIAAE